jgi:hypothetical protein
VRAEYDGYMSALAQSELLAKPDEAYQSWNLRVAGAVIDSLKYRSPGPLGIELAKLKVTSVGLPLLPGNVTVPVFVAMAPVPAWNAADVANTSNVAGYPAE